MNREERRIADTTGRFLVARKDGTEVDDPHWSTARCLLSNRRLVLVGRQGKRSIPLPSVRAVRPRAAVEGSFAGVARYTSVRTRDGLVILSVKDARAFELDLCSALLADERVLVRHPAVEGGVVRETEWEQGRVTLGDHETLDVASSSGSYVGIELADVGTVEVAERSVNERRRKVIEVEHAEEGTSVETHLAGSGRCCSFLMAILADGVDGTNTEVDLDGEQKQVLMALYSGVSPFEIPEFTGVDVDRVEETYAHLIELNVLQEVRRRREVELTPRGRNLASQAISDE